MAVQSDRQKELDIGKSRLGFVRLNIEEHCGRVTTGLNQKQQAAARITLRILARALKHTGRRRVLQYRHDIAKLVSR